MAIRLEVKEYCADCCDFTADVTGGERVAVSYNEDWMSENRTDTIIRCKNAKRCASLVRYLEKKMEVK